MLNKKEESILIAATELFSKFGYHAVGVDLIIKEANVAKMTFYKFFPSKNVLIQRALLRRSLFLQKSITACADSARTPIGKVKSIFNWYERWTSSADFHGCMFIKASEEFSSSNDPIKLAVQIHKKWLVTHIVALLDELNIANIHKIAKYIIIILDGLAINANTHNSTKMTDLHFSWKCVKQLIEFNQKTMTV